MTYTLTKANTKIQIRIMPDTAELIRSVDGNISTSKEVMTPTEATRTVNELVRDGYVATKRKS